MSEEMEQIKQRIIEFLTEMSSQNNRGTAFPYYYTIADEREKFEIDPYGDYIYDHYTNSMREIKAIIQEEYEHDNFDLQDGETLEDLMNDVESYRSQEILENYLNESSPTRFTKEWQTYYEGVFFTENDAKAYLESARNHHFGPNPRTYVDCFNCWGRHSKTEDFLTDIFNYFGVKLPPEMYYENQKKEGETNDENN